jgi:hypothetical protein
VKVVRSASLESAILFFTNATSANQNHPIACSRNRCGATLPSAHHMSYCSRPWEPFSKFIETIENFPNGLGLCFGCGLPFGKRLFDNIVPSIEDESILRWSHRIMLVFPGFIPLFILLDFCDGSRLGPQTVGLEIAVPPNALSPLSR